MNMWLEIIDPDLCNKSDLLKNKYIKYLFEWLSKVFPFIQNVLAKMVWKFDLRLTLEFSTFIIQERGTGIKYFAQSLR